MLRPPYRDLSLALILGVISIIAPRLEPNMAETWTLLPLTFAAPLVASGLLLLVPWKPAVILAMMIHVLMLVVCGLTLLLCALLLVTILFFGTGIVLGAPAALLALNSAVTLKQVRPR